MLINLLKNFILNQECEVNGNSCQTSETLTSKKINESYKKKKIILDYLEDKENYNISNEIEN